MVDVRQPSGTFHSEQRGVALAHDGTYHRRNGTGTGDGLEPVVVDERSASDLSLLVSEPRLLTENDIPWLYDICRRRYSSKYDPIATELWFRNTVLKQPMFFCPQRTDRAFCISQLSAQYWLPTEYNCNIAFIAAEEGAGWEALKLLRCSIEWANKRKCTTWAVASDTPVDLKALALRVGAEEIYPRYVIRFNNG